MRLVIFLIISSFLVNIPAHGFKVAAKGDIVIKADEQKSYAAEPLDVSASFEKNGLVSSSHFRRVSSSQYRILICSKVAYTLSHEVHLKDLLDKNFLTNPYLHCKPIGLKLIFPQHYFW